jgi:hypothetical protein
MKKIYLKIFIGFIFFLWTVYFIQCLFDNNKKESFIPKITEIYRPYIRNIDQNYEKLINNYGPNVVMVKLKKWNIF